jgi:hypothetical protein
VHQGRIDTARRGATRDAVHLAHEARGEKAAGVPVDPVRRAFVLDAAGVHDHDPVGDRRGLLLIVGDVDEGRADAALDRLEFVLHRAAELQVEGSQGLVEEKHVRLGRQRPGQRHALTLAARKLVRALRRRSFEADQRELLLGRGVSRRARDPSHAQSEGHVGPERDVREERIVLEHRCRGPTRRRHACHISPTDEHPPLGRGHEAAQHRQERGLAAARGPEKHNIFPGCDVQSDPGQGPVLAEAVRHGVERQRGGHARRLGWRNEYGGLKLDQVRRLKELELENSRLRKAVSNLTLDKLILTEALSGK